MIPIPDKVINPLNYIPEYGRSSCEYLGGGGRVKLSVSRIFQSAISVDDS